MPLRIELLEVVPLVWRRVLVPDQWTMANLQQYLQWVMGWTDSHAHELENRSQFATGSVRSNGRQTSPPPRLRYVSASALRPR